MAAGNIESADFSETGYSYTLTSLGKSLMKILDQLCVWGLEHRPRSAK